MLSLHHFLVLDDRGKHVKLVAHILDSVGQIGGCTNIALGLLIGLPRALATDAAVNNTTLLRYELFVELRLFNCLQYGQRANNLTARIKPGANRNIRFH